LIEEGAVVVIKETGEEKILDWRAEIEVSNNLIIRRGSRNFKKIKII